MLLDKLLVGQFAKADHPITVLNPKEIFEITNVKVLMRSKGPVIFVRGEDTMWFSESMFKLTNM